MRIPSLTRSSKSNSRATEDHRRSWHVSPTHQNHGNRRSSKGGGRHRTWHFPRISRHSVHQSHHTRHGEVETTGTCSRSKFNDEYDAELGQQQERKTFSYAAHARDETATRAPSPPETDSTETALTLTGQTDLPDPNRNKRKDGWFRRVGRKTLRAFRAVEDFLFPGCHPLHGSVAQHQKQQRVRGGVLMRSCLTAEEHKAKARETVEAANSTLYGKKGLFAVGFEYRLVSSSGEKEPGLEGEDAKTPYEEEDIEFVKLVGPEKTAAQSVGKELVDSKNALCSNDAANTFRLFHIESNTQIDSTNRKLFIADGDMYDAVAKLCQENAHEVMQQKHGMVWVTLCPPDEGDDCHPLKRNKHEPVRALVNREHFAALDPSASISPEVQYFRQRPTLVIITGKGKVRAGIFSRQHLLVSGMESSTALPLIQEARLRKLNLVLIDPNVHGDALAMVTFEKSMEKLFHQWERNVAKENTGGSVEKEQQLQSCRDLYILSHSASGSQLGRYLLDKWECYLPHIQAIAFTDSTHNVQWARQRAQHQLVDFLESSKCVYFRCSANGSEYPAGEQAPTDKFWQHRFGNIRTCWAGTSEHSLTNWFAHTHIWEHFDTFLAEDNAKESGEKPLSD